MWQLLHLTWLWYPHYTHFPWELTTWVEWKCSYRRVFHLKWWLDWIEVFCGKVSIPSKLSVETKQASAGMPRGQPALNLLAQPSAYTALDFLALWLQDFPADWLMEAKPSVRYQLSQLFPCVTDILWRPQLEIWFLQPLLIPLSWVFILLKLSMFYFCYLQFRVAVVVVVVYVLCSRRWSSQLSVLVTWFPAPGASSESKAGGGFPPPPH